MDTASALHRFESALADQLALTDDPAVEAAGRSLSLALRPAARELAFDLASQAAEEVRAQLGDREVEVVLADGEPAIAIRDRAGAGSSTSTSDEDYEARLTLRLPPSIKERIEEAAEHAGGSINRWVVEALSDASRPTTRPGRRVQGTVRT